MGAYESEWSQAIHQDLRETTCRAQPAYFTTRHKEGTIQSDQVGDQ